MKAFVTSSAEYKVKPVAACFSVIYSNGFGQNHLSTVAKIILFNKPFGVLSQFTDTSKRPTLADYVELPKVYPAGRLDANSEGLLLLTDSGQLQHAISHPKHKLYKTYWVQVEGIPARSTLERLRKGILLKDGPTLPAQADFLATPNIWPRDPPIRYRAIIPTSWLTISIREGRNRQIRRMTAALGFPTLRLIRTAIGPWQIGDIPLGKYQVLEVSADALARNKTDAK